MQFCLLQISAIQSKQKGVILCRPGSISRPPYFFIYSLWFFLTSFLYNSSINQFLNYFITHACLKTKKNPPKRATEHNSNLNSFVNIELLLNFLLLVLVLLISWQNFDSEKCSGISCARSTKTLVFLHAERFSLPF